MTCFRQVQNSKIMIPTEIRVLTHTFVPIANTQEHESGFAKKLVSRRMIGCDLHKKNCVHVSRHGIPVVFRLHRNGDNHSNAQHILHILSYMFRPCKSAFRQNCRTFLAHSSKFRRWVLSRGDTRGDAWWRNLEHLTKIAQ